MATHIRASSETTHKPPSPLLTRPNSYLPGHTSVSSTATISSATGGSGSSATGIGSGNGLNGSLSLKQIDLVNSPFHQKQVSTAVFDFLVIEIVPLAVRIVDEISINNNNNTGNGNGNGAAMTTTTTTHASNNSITNNNANANDTTTTTTASTTDEVYFRVEQYGYRLGRGLAEVFTRERGRFANQLDVMKFVCKELWPLVFKKQIDNLKTNHRVCSSCCSSSCIKEKKKKNANKTLSDNRELTC